MSYRRMNLPLIRDCQSVVLIEDEVFDSSTLLQQFEVDLVDIFNAQLWNEKTSVTE